MGETEQRAGINKEESLILDVLDAERPLDVIGIASSTRLPVERVLNLLEGLEQRGLVERVKPEPVHERFSPTGPLQHA